MNIKHRLWKLFRRMGYDVSKVTSRSHTLGRRKHLMSLYDIDTVIDVGANTGQYALQLMQDLGYSKRIVSFEPLNSAFSLLADNASKHSNWEAFNFALGDTEETSEINISGNSGSSSILNMLPSHTQSAPHSEYIDTQEINIKTLDSIFHSLFNEDNNIFLKIDTQGFEENVLRGAEESLKHIDTLQIEMSLVPLYEGEMLFNEMHTLMISKGYNLIAIEPGFADKNTGHTLQADGIFHRMNKPQ